MAIHLPVLGTNCYAVISAIMYTHACMHASSHAHKHTHADMQACMHLYVQSKRKHSQAFGEQCYILLFQRWVCVTQMSEGQSCNCNLCPGVCVDLGPTKFRLLGIPASNNGDLFLLCCGINSSSL